MTFDQDYRLEVARLRAALNQAEELPAFMQPDAQVVTETIAERARSVRDAILRGDLSALRDLSSEQLAAAGFNRSEADPSQDIPELDAAREEIKQERRRRAIDDDEFGGQDRQDDPL